jgi:beta-glucosidase
VMLEAGESKQVTVKLEPLAMSVWDVKKQQWVKPTGEYRVMVGGSSEQLPLTATRTER